MKDLLLKYKNNKLTFNELQSLRDTLSKVSREEVEKILFEDWQDGEFDCSAQDEQLKSMLDNIKAQIQTSERPTMARFVTFKLICRVVAAVLIPALIVSSIYFYGLSSQQLNNSTVVITGKGETATIVLPDLSTVELKSMSELSYSTTDFNHKT
jgi:ferric-dicitrate binding protein FerR (iron transport regulator)